MKRIAFMLVLFVAIPSAAQTVTLTITPDKQVYQVGEQIVLNVFGDAEGAQDNAIYGRILFDPTVADYVESHEVPLTSVSGALTWITGPLAGGEGFAEAFHQGPPSINPLPVDGPLVASVKLLATAPGTLEYSWQTDGALELRLDFFDLFSAPGGSVTIVPEPSTGALLALGLVATALTRRRSGRLSQRARLVQTGRHR